MNVRAQELTDRLVTKGQSFDDHDFAKLVERLQKAEDRALVRFLLQTGGKSISRFVDGLPSTADGIKQAVAPLWQNNIAQVKYAAEKDDPLLQGMALTQVRNTLNLMHIYEATLHTAEQTAEKLYYAVTHDDQTGAFNKRFFGDELQRQMDQAGRYNRPLSVITFDVDNFGNVNENGHLIADEIVKQIAGYTTSHLRKADILARTGSGDEFSIILPQTGEPGAIQDAERIRDGISKEKFEYSGHIIPVTISAGVKAYAGEHRWETLFNAADQALYGAKELGRNKVLSFSQLEQLAGEHAWAEQRVERARNYAPQ